MSGPQSRLNTLHLSRRCILKSVNNYIPNVDHNQNTPFSVSGFKKLTDLVEPNETGLSSSHTSPQTLRFRPSLDSFVDDFSKSRPIRIFESQSQNAEQHVFMPAYADVVAEGALVEVKRARYKKVSNSGADHEKFIKIKGKDDDYRMVGEKTGDGTRGKAQFTASSRRRLMRKIGAVNRDSKPLFVTLTYPDVFPDDSRR